MAANPNRADNSVRLWRRKPRSNLFESAEASARDRHREGPGGPIQPHRWHGGVGRQPDARDAALDRASAHVRAADVLPCWWGDFVASDLEPMIRDLVLIGIDAGMRRGEIASGRRQRLDLERRIPRVEEIMTGEALEATIGASPAPSSRTGATTATRAVPPERVRWMREALSHEGARDPDHRRTGLLPQRSVARCRGARRTLAHASRRRPAESNVSGSSPRMDAIPESNPGACSAP